MFPFLTAVVCDDLSESSGPTVFRLRIPGFEDHCILFQSFLILILPV